MIAAILGHPAIYADRFLYWFGEPRHQGTELARQLAESLGVPMVVVAYMPPVERAALAAWAIREIDRARAHQMPVAQWFALEDCRISLWQQQRRAHADFANA
jgi:pyrroloquinoline quinone (PQQ) biosynthesis protein C